MDIVYLVKEGAYNLELIYSVRSVCKNLPFKRIWFIGGCPEGILPDMYYPFRRISNIKTRNTAKMYELICGINEISDDFMLFNDDFFIMNQIDELPPRYWQTLKDKVALMKQIYGSTRWATLLEIASDALKEKQYEQYNFELHVPMVFNKEKLARTIRKFPDIPCKRSLYGNMYKLYETGLERPDGKIHDLNIDIFNADIISTDDESFKSGAIGRRIRKEFPNPSKYEI